MNIQQSFQILGLSRSASPQAAKSAYRKLVKTYHPDRFAHDPNRSSAAEETIKQINDAYGQVRSYFSSESRGRQHHIKNTQTPPQDVFKAKPSGIVKKKRMQREHSGRIKQNPKTFSSVLKEALESQVRQTSYAHDSQLKSSMIRNVVSDYYSYARFRNPVRKPFGPIQEVKPVPPVSPVRPRS